MQKRAQGNTMTNQDINAAPVELLLTVGDPVIEMPANQPILVQFEIHVQAMGNNVRTLTLQLYRGHIFAKQIVAFKAQTQTFIQITECVFISEPIMWTLMDGDEGFFTAYLSSDNAGDNDVTIQATTYITSPVFGTESVQTAAGVNISRWNEYPVDVDGTSEKPAVSVNDWVGEPATITGGLPNVNAAASGGATPLTAANINAECDTAMSDYGAAQPGDSMDVSSISGDSSAADNLELQYDGNGLLGDAYPLRQDQGASIAGGLAVQTTMASVTVIQGSEQDLANASTSDDSRWTGDDDGAGAEFIFRCTPANEDAHPADLHFEGYYDEPVGATNSASLQVYNFEFAQWDTVLSLTNSAGDEAHDLALSSGHRAPGGGTLETVAYTAGDVLIKFVQDVQETGNACLLIDVITVGMVSSASTAAQAADAVWDEATAGHTGAGTYGKRDGYLLASDGLDSVATTQPSGVASNFREMLVQVWRRFFKKTTASSSSLKTYNDAGAVNTSQPVSFDGTTKEVSNAS